MPRAVLSWFRCDVCGNNPAVRVCGGSVVCERCYHALGSYLGCARLHAGRPGQQAAEVDEELISRIKRRAYRRRQH